MTLACVHNNNGFGLYDLINKAIKDSSTNCAMLATKSSNIYSANSARVPTKSSNIDFSGVNSNNGFGLQDIINKAVKDLDVPRADGTDGNNITAKLDKLSLPVSGPGVAAQSLLVSSRSTTPSLPSRTPSPWTDDDLPQVLPNLPKSLPDLPKVLHTTINTSTNFSFVLKPFWNDMDRGIKHDFPFIGIRKVRREVLKISVFNTSRGTLQMSMNDKTCLIAIIA